MVLPWNKLIKQRRWSKVRDIKKNRAMPWFLGNKNKNSPNRYSVCDIFRSSCRRRMDRGTWSASLFRSDRSSACAMPFVATRCARVCIVSSVRFFWWKFDRRLQMAFLLFLIKSNVPPSPLRRHFDKFYFFICVSRPLTPAPKPSATIMIYWLFLKLEVGMVFFFLRLLQSFFVLDHPSLLGWCVEESRVHLCLFRCDRYSRQAPLVNLKSKNTQQEISKSILIVRFCVVLFCFVSLVFLNFCFSTISIVSLQRRIAIARTDLAKTSKTTAATDPTCNPQLIPRKLRWWFVSPQTQTQLEDGERTRRWNALRISNERSRQSLQLPPMSQSTSRNYDSLLFVR